MTFVGRTEEIVRAEGLRKRYRMGEVTVEALRGVDLVLRKGEYACISGASGSGKSTLLNILGCLDRPTSGTFLLAGRDVSLLGGNDLALVRNRFIGFVFQTFNLLPRANAARNVELPLIYAGVRGSRRRELARESLRRVGLEGRFSHSPAQLSGGERQRVAIARALVNEPALLLFFVPMVILDSKTGAGIMDLFEELHAEGNTLLMVSHDPEVAARARRRITLTDGRITADTSGRV
jgi:putative ABC transport system ATP-binding protein